MRLTIDVLKEAAHKAREAAMPLLGKPQASEALGRGAGGDETLTVDHVAEEAILGALQRSVKDCTVVSEESGVVTLGDRDRASNCFIIIDSVDGSNNAVRGLPFAAVSLAAADGPMSGDVFLGAVLDLYSGEIFTAEKHVGAKLNDATITVSNEDSLDAAIVGIDLSKLDDEAALKRITRLLLEAKHTRHLGANALELCYIAAGREDAFIDIRSKLRVTDIAAGLLILREAGGIVVDEKLQPLTTPITSPTHRVSLLAACNSKLLEALSKALYG